MNSLKRLTLSALVFVCLATCFIGCKRVLVSKPAEHSIVPAIGGPSPATCSVPFNGNFVNDTAAVLNDEARDKLEQKLDALKAAGKIDFAVVTIKTTDSQSIEEYSLALARCWSLGKTNPDGAGMLLTLAIDDRKWRLEISRSMEKILSNEEIQAAGSQMTIHLRERGYAEGIDKFIDATINTIAPRRKFSMGTP